MTMFADRQLSFYQQSLGPLFVDHLIDFSLQWSSQCSKCESRDCKGLHCILYGNCFSAAPNTGIRLEYQLSRSISTILTL